MTIGVPRRDRRATPRMSGRFLVRVGGLPLTAAAGLSFPDTAAWADRTLDHEEDLRTRGHALADRLGAVVSDAPDRAPLIALRRDVYNGRAPRDPARADALLAAAAPHLTGAFRDWLAAHGRHAAEQLAGPGVFDGELPPRRAALRRLATTPELRHGLLLASRELDRQVHRYLGATGTRLDKRTRRVERSLAEYAYRAATKTSPFATFTTVCVGEFAAGPGPRRLISPHLTGPGPHAHPRLAMTALVAVAQAITARQRYRAELPVRLVTGVRPGRDRTSYLRRTEGAGAGDGPVGVEVVQEDLFHLPSSEVLRTLTDLLDGGRTRPLRDLAAELVAADPDRHSAADVDRYLGHLLRLGLLVSPALRIDIHHADPLADFRTGIRALGHPWAAEVADRLDTVAGHLAGYAAADLDGRRHRLDAIGAELGAAYAGLGAAQPPPDPLVYEDVALPGRIVADPVATRTLMEDLAAVAEILPAFDVNIARRVVTKGYFRARYGAGGTCDDLVTFAHEYQEDFFDHFVSSQFERRPFDQDNRYVPQANTFGLREIDQLDEARLTAARMVREAYGELPPGAEELVLGDRFVDDLRRCVPGTLGPVATQSFFVQVADRPRGPLAVVNKGFSGPAALLSRFAHCLGAAGVELLGDELRTAAPTDAVLAELKGGYEASNLNLHPAVTEYELVCPGDISSRPPHRQIPVDDLVLHDDVAGDRLVLRSRRLGVEVIPVYLGFLLPLALPKVQQVLLAFSPTGLAALDLWAGTTVPLPGTGIAGYPRIRYRDVVLQRRMWKAHPDCLPASPPEADGSRLMLDWARWRRTHGLPRRVFVASDGGATDDAGGGGGVAGDGAGAGTRKPLYVDFDSYYALTLLAATARRTRSRLVFTEMLPDHHEQAYTTAGTPHVSELLLAFHGPTGGSPR